MNRLLLLAFGLLVNVAQAEAPAAAPPPALTAAGIAARNVAARGGLTAWRAVSTLVLAGEMEAGGTKNAALPFVLRLKRPHRSRLELRFQNQIALQIFDGTRGWKLRPFLGRNDVEPYTDTEARSAAAWEELDGPLVDYAGKGTRIALAGMEAVDGHDAYRLKLTLKTGTERSVWIDAASFLELKIDGEPRLLDGAMRHTAIYFRAFQSVGGLTLPRILETVVDGGKQGHRLTIERVDVNRPLADDLFTKPAPSVASVVGR